MKSWMTGKQELLRELEKVYDSIGRNLAVELDDQSTVKVNTAQLRMLEENSWKYQDLVKQHPNLEDQLQKYTSVCSRQDELANSNKRLTAQLQQARRRQTPISSSPARPDHTPSEPITPLATAVTDPKHLDLFDPILLNAGTEHDCEALVDKYTLVYKQWEIEKRGRQLYEAKWKRERDKVKDWVKYCDRQEKNVAKKRNKINTLKEEVRHLQSHPDDLRIASDKQLSDGLSKPPTEISNSTPPRGSPPSFSLAKANAQSPSALTTPRGLNEDRSDILLVPGLELQDYMLMHSTLPGQLSCEETKDVELPPLPHNAKTIILDSQAESDNESPIYHELSTVGEDSASKDDRQSARETDTVKQEAPPNDHDSLVVVSARTIKKRKRRAENDLPKPGPNIKQEILSSSPIGLTEFDNLGSNDSVDLDEIGQKVDTPRKHRRRLFELSQERGSTSRRTTLAAQSSVRLQAPEQTNDNIKQAIQTTPALKLAAGRTGSALQPRSANEQIVSRIDSQTSKKRRLISDVAVESLAEDGSTPTSLSSRKSRAVRGILDDLLGKLPSPTKPAINPRPSNRISELAAKTTTQHAQEAYDARTENRELNNSSLYLKSFSTDNPNSSGRVARNDALSRRSSTSATPRPSREVTTPGGAQNWRKPTRTTPSLAEAGTNQVCDPIRSRPVSSLRLEDFKVNPKYNQGYSYAYTDVVRNKDDRRCLQGCTKPGCCGERFRALALATRPVGEITLSQEEADNELLREFLGDNAHKLRNLNKHDRDDLLLQAKTRELANKHGRHRHMYEKPSSPPGFWRADFPSTQEDLLDRERAKQVERDQIIQRYEEAMRPGGAFIFRDEQVGINQV